MARAAAASIRRRRQRVSWFDRRPGGIARASAVPPCARWRRTRDAAWSAANPWFFLGKAGEGIGGPHQGEDFIWPMSLIVRALSSGDDATILACLRTLKATHAGTGFMHEAFHKDDAAKFTRDWFAWANGLFGELILHLARTRPKLLSAPLAG